MLTLIDASRTEQSRGHPERAPELAIAIKRARAEQRLDQHVAASTASHQVVNRWPITDWTEAGASQSIGI